MAGGAVLRRLTQLQHMRLRTHLIILVVGSLLPLLVFAVFAVGRSAADARTAIEHRLRTNAADVAEAIDREFEKSTAALQVLAESRTLDKQDLHDFYEHAEAARARLRWGTIALIDRDGTQVANLLRPLGASMPNLRDRRYFQETVRTRQPVISDLYEGSITQRWVTAVAVPVLRNGSVTAVVVAVVYAADLESLVTNQLPGEKWTRAVVDRAGVIAARTRAPEEVVGRPASPEFRARIAQAAQGFYTETTVDGTKVYGAFARARLSQWTAAVAVPATAVEAPLWRRIAPTAVTGGGVLMLGVLVALFGGRHIATAMSEASAAAEALARGGRVAAPKSSVTEVRQLGTALDASAYLLGERDRQRNEAQARLQAALEDGGMATFVWDLTRDDTGVDEAMGRFFGHPAADMFGGRVDTFLSTVHPDDRDHVGETLERTIQDGSEFDVVYRAMRPDGVTLWIDCRARVERDVDGRPKRLTGVCVDVTARKQTEESLRQAHKMEALGTLAGGIAHDFNNILTAILGNVTLAMENLPADHPAQQRLATIERASIRAADLVRRILTFSRRRSVAPEPVNLAPVVDEAIELLRATLPAMIEIRSRVDSTLPAVAADAGQIHQVLMNLGANASYAMREHGGVLEVSVEAVSVNAEHARSISGLRVGPYVKLVVTDTGCGMDAATLARIFDPFFTTKGPKEGTGLGLSVVHGIMQSHDGAITVDSVPGRGTAFQLYFPVIETVAVDAPERETAALGHGERVLYVDDEEALIVLGTDMLRRLGYEVTACSSPADAFETLRSRPNDFDGVVTDVAMPGMSGLDLAALLLRIRPGLPIVMCSGYFTDTDAAAARRLGIRCMVQKPFSENQLAVALHGVFEGAPRQHGDGAGPTSR